MDFANELDIVIMIHGTFTRKEKLLKIIWGV